LNLSIGIASLAETRNALELVAAADADMYRVKQASRAELLSK
jgi:GGDEF domain-containing protein